MERAQWLEEQEAAQWWQRTERALLDHLRLALQRHRFATVDTAVLAAYLMKSPEWTGLNLSIPLDIPKALQWRWSTWENVARRMPDALKQYCEGKKDKAPDLVHLAHIKYDPLAPSASSPLALKLEIHLWKRVPP